jgi:hypothetical protein
MSTGLPSKVNGGAEPVTVGLIEDGGGMVSQHKGNLGATNVISVPVDVEQRLGIN